MLDTDVPESTKCVFSACSVALCFLFISFFVHTSLLNKTFSDWPSSFLKFFYAKLVSNRSFAKFISKWCTRWVPRNEMLNAFSVRWTAIVNGAFFVSLLFPCEIARHANNPGYLSVSFLCGYLSRTGLSSTLDFESDVNTLRHLSSTRHINSKQWCCLHLKSGLFLIQLYDRLISLRSLAS